jgi:putative adenylate-forming enzyme
MRDEWTLLRAFAAAKYRYWRGIRAPDIADDTPVCDALDFNRNFERYNILGISLSEARRLARLELEGAVSPYAGISFGLSTGTGGEPGVFMTSAHERSEWAGMMLARFLPLRQIAGADVALLLKHNNRLYTESAKSRVVRFSYFDIQRPMEEWIERLCFLDPGVLVGPPSMLRAIVFTKAFERKPMRPRALIAGAEPLFPQDRRLIEERYGVAPRIVYQAREGFLGVGCRYGNVHLNEDAIRFELLSFAGRPERVIPIITDCRRTTQTYRRYRMDDVLIMAAARCQCGNPFRAATAVEGRLQDVFVRPGGRWVFPLDLNSILMRWLEPENQFTMEQHGMDSFALGIEHGAAKPALVDELREHLGGQAEVELVPYASPGLGDKQRRFRRLFNP